MNIINIICWAVNRKNYNYNINTPTIHQMNWFKPIPEVIKYMVDSIKFQIVKSIDGDPMKDLIKILMEKKDYSTTDINNVDPKKSFDILHKNTETISTKNMGLRIPTMQEIENNSCEKNDGYENDDNGHDDNGDDDGMCVIMGGRKTRKSKRKYKTIFNSKSSKKSKIKTKRKSQKKTSRKTKRTHVK